MALSELYEIGKRSRNPLAGVTKATRRGEGGRSLVTPLDDADVEAKIADDQDVIARKEGLASKTISSSTQRCMICRVQASKYNCPSCNIAYCSLICYQSKKHESCSRPFLQKALKEEMGTRNGKGDDQDGLVDEEERKAMMDVLRRMKTLGSEADQDEGEEDGGNMTGDDEGEDIDLDEASVEQLLTMLSPEERARFQAAVEDQDPNQSRARSLYEKISQTQNDDQTTVKPWWEQSNPEKPSASLFTKQAEELSQQASKAKTAMIEYNILAVLLAYAYVVRHVDVTSLQDLRGEAGPESEDDMPPLESADGNELREDIEERDTLKEIVKMKVKLFAPFLAVSGEPSRILLDSAEQVTLSFVAAQIREDAAMEPAAETLSFLYKDVQSIITSPRLTEISSFSNTDRVLLAFPDLSPFLPLPSQKKLLFYAVYWLRLDQTSRKELQEHVAKEISRLEVEVQHAEDQERFQAANEAVQQQIVY